MHKIIDIISAAFFPQRCPYCNDVVAFGKKACDSCLEKFPEKEIQGYAAGSYLCYSAFFYDDDFSPAIKRFKFYDYPQYSKKLAVPLADVIKKFDVRFDLITYVPMYPLRERKRGYNQAKLLAKDVSKILDIPMESLLEKIKDNEPQHRLNIKDKKQNVKGVFAAINKEKIKDKNILVIDDVITTGYTLGECCKILLKNKANTICCATVCMSKQL